MSLPANTAFAVAPRRSLTRLARSRETSRGKNPGTCERSLALLPPGPDAVRNDRSPAGATSLAATAHELDAARRAAFVAAQVVPTRDHPERHPPAGEARATVPAHDVSRHHGPATPVLLTAVEDDPAMLGARAGVVGDEVVLDPEVERELAAAVRLDVDAGRRIAAAAGVGPVGVRGAGDPVAGDPEPDEADRRDDVAAAAREAAPEDRDAACIAVAVRAVADVDVVDGRAADGHVPHDHLVAIDRDAVGAGLRRDDDSQAADRHVDRSRVELAASVDEEDGVRRDRIAVGRTEAN